MFDVGSIVARLTADTSGFQKAIQNAGKQVSSFTERAGRQLDSFKKTIQNVGEGMKQAGQKMSLFLTTPIVGAGLAGLKAAMDMEATGAKFNTVFGELTGEADKFIKKFQELTPATRAQARNMASGIQDLLIPMGYARDEATEMTGEFMHVAGALQAFNSGTHDTQRVMDAMNAALIGSYEPLTSLGIQLDVNTVKEKAVAMGLAATTKEVTKQHQAQVALAEIYAQSGDALTAYTAENLDAGTKIKILTSRVIDIAASIFEKFIPALHTLIGIVENWIAKFEELDEGTQNIILVVLGVIATIGPLILIIGTLLKSIATIISVGLFLTKVLGGVTIAIKALTIAKMIMFGKVMLVIGIISALVAGLIWLGRNSHIVRANLASAWHGIVSTVAIAYHQIRHWIGGIINTAQSIGHHIWAVSGNIFNAIISPFQRAYNFIAGIFRNVGNLVSGAVDRIPAGVRSLIPRFASGIQNFAGGLAQINERGGELIGLPQGATVIPASLSQSMLDGLRPATAGVTIQNVTINENADTDRFFRELDRRTRDENIIG